MENEILPKHTESFWHKTSSVGAYPKLEKDLNVDLAVVGGGIAGILAAYELSKRGKSVVLLEARKLIYGTTGFTTSKLNAQHGIIYDSLIQRYGKERAKSYYDANIEGIEIIKEIAQKHEIECELKEDDSYYYTNDESKINYVKREAKAYEILDIKGGFTEKIPVDLDIKAAVVMYKQYEFHPVMFLSGVLKELEKMGVLIFEQTMVTEINDGDQVSLKTEEGKIINCKQAICASHYPVDDPDNYYAKNLKPNISFATVYKYNDKYPGGMYFSADEPSRTFRSVDANEEKYLLVGGESHSPGDGTSDLERYNSIVSFAKESFGVDGVIARWSSHDYITKDKVAFIGLTSPKRKNIYLVTGLNKWGLSNAGISSRILADIIEGKENPYKELFNPNREIPDLEELEQEKIQQERVNSTSKRKEVELNLEEALVYDENDKKYGIFKDANENIHHLDLTCTHLGCKLGWNDGDKTWDCGCHGSRYNAIGKVIEGPAMTELKRVDQKNKNKKD